MTETRRYTIEVKEAKSKSAVVAAVVDWTSDDKRVAVAQIFRLPGLASSNGLVHRLSQQHSAIGTQPLPPNRRASDEHRFPPQ